MQVNPASANCWMLAVRHGAAQLVLFGFATFTWPEQLTGHMGLLSGGYI
jgi:hypothetical protein